MLENINNVENIINVFTKQATLIRRSTVPSLPPQLVFPAYPHEASVCPFQEFSYKIKCGAVRCFI
jgi:hypothetical protein